MVKYVHYLSAEPEISDENNFKINQSLYNWQFSEG